MLELPKRELLIISEVAEYFSVTERTIRLWIEHGHLIAEKIVGSRRVTRESVLKCRFANRTETEQPEPQVEMIQAEKKKPGRPKVN